MPQRVPFVVHTTLLALTFLLLTFLLTFTLLFPASWARAEANNLIAPMEAVERPAVERPHVAAPENPFGSPKPGASGHPEGAESTGAGKDDAAPKGAMDVHAHALPPEYRRFIEEHGAGMEETFPLPAWDVQNHLSFMDEAGIATSVLTLPAPHPHFGDTRESVAIVRRLNDFHADLKKKAPRAFSFLRHTSLPDVEASMAEAKRAFEELGADGVKLATNHRGLLLGDPALAPSWSF